MGKVEVAGPAAENAIQPPEEKPTLDEIKGAHATSGEGSSSNPKTREKKTWNRKKK